MCQPPPPSAEDIDQVCKDDKIFLLVELFLKEHVSYMSKPTFIVQDLGQNDICILRG